MLDATEVLKQLAPVVSYHSLVALGIASIQGMSVASFEKEYANRLLCCCTKQGKEFSLQNPPCSLPSWSPSPTRQISGLGRNPVTVIRAAGENGVSWRKADQDDQKELAAVMCMPSTSGRQRLKAAAMRPIPHARKCKMMPFGIVPAAIAYDGSQMKPSLPILPIVKHSFVPTPPATHRKSTSSSLRAQQIISLNPLPMKEHGCDRPPIRVCSEEEFLRDVIQFRILRGHSRLVPQGGITEFPDAILNGKRLDLYNLYGEVVSRGGFYVGNGINWKGQVFSKMRNHTVSNRMTRHYETYLLEYELAHDDVDGECCLLCKSNAPADWVNCGYVVNGRTLVAVDGRVLALSRTTPKRMAWNIFARIVA